ncbi:hypothetical protein LINPERHAP1_LOCUS22727 [Linum perenne]
MGWKGMNCSAPFIQMNKVVLHSFFWHVWLERNDIIFREAKASASRVLFRTLASCVSWLKVFALISQHNFELWLRQLTAT